MKSTVCGALLCLLSASATAADGVESVSNISQELVEIREQIENLHAQINQQKELSNDRVRSLANQKSDLEVRIGRSDLSQQELQRELDKLATKNSASSASSSDLEPVLITAIADLRQAVEQDLPFKRAERLQALDELQSRLSTHAITSNRAANQLWAFVEDELMLGKTNGLYTDTLDVNGELTLVKVLRLGKVAMFFRTNEMEYGVVKKQGANWNNVMISDPVSVAELDKLFDAFTKNIRTGHFSVPNFLPENP